MDLCGDNLENVSKIINAPSGIAVKMYGKDVDDNLVEDDVPSGGATAFTELSDVPQSYTDQAGKMLIVNDDEDALEFTESHNHLNKTDLDNYDPDNFAVSNHNHNLNDLTEKSYNSLTDKPTIPTGLPEGIHGNMLVNNDGTWEATANIAAYENAYSQYIMNVMYSSIKSYLEIRSDAYGTELELTGKNNRSNALLYLSHSFNGSSTETSNMLQMKAKGNTIQIASKSQDAGNLVFTYYNGTPAVLEFSIDYAGKILSNYLAGTGNRPLYADTSGNIVADSDAVILKKAKVTLTRSQILDLHNTPVELLPELPEGQSYYPIQIFLKSGETNLYSNGNVQVGFGDYYISGIYVNENYHSIGLGVDAAFSVEPNYNTAITINNTGDPITDSGNSDPIDIYLVYYILEL